MSLGKKLYTIFLGTIDHSYLGCSATRRRKAAAIPNNKH